METLSFDLLQWGYHVALAVIVGGALALGRSPSSSSYDGLVVLAVLVLWVTTVVKAFSFEVAEPRLVVRWVAVVLCGLSALYGAAWAGPVARTIRRSTPGFDDLRPEAAPRVEEVNLHRRAAGARRSALLLGLVALFLS